LLAAVGIKLRFPGNSDEITWMIPVLVLGIPIFDTTLVFISRLRRGLNPLTTPGRDHLSHRLVHLGLSPRRAVLTIYGVGILLGGLAFAVQVLTLPAAYALFAVVMIVGAISIWRLERVSSRS
jgi:UDP-GlcNAc:undecaprenyl-phosphate GlcNAc-1-phosphate transferase